MRLASLSLLVAALVACGGPAPSRPPPERADSRAAPPTEPPPPEPFDWSGPTRAEVEAQIAALEAQRTRASLQTVAPEEAEAIGGWRLGRSTRVFVHEDVDALGLAEPLGHACRAVPARTEDDGTLALVVAETRQGRCRTSTELRLGAALNAVVEGEPRGCDGITESSPAPRPVAYRLVEADATRAVFSADALATSLICAPRPARAPCPGGGTAACVVPMPALQVRPLSSSEGMARTAPMPSSDAENACQVTCQPGACEEVVGEHPDALRGVVHTEGDRRLVVFRRRAACMTYARARTEIRERLEASAAEAAPAQAPAARARTVRVEVDGPQPFRGDVERILEARLRAIDRCVRELEPPASTGSVPATLAVDMAGDVAVSPALDAAADPRQRCLVAVLEGLRFDPGPTERSETFEVELHVGVAAPEAAP